MPFENRRLEALYAFANSTPLGSMSEMLRAESDVFPSLSTRRVILPCESPLNSWMLFSRVRSGELGVAKEKTALITFVCVACTPAASAQERGNPMVAVVWIKLVGLAVSLTVFDCPGARLNGAAPAIVTLKAVPTEVTLARLIIVTLIEKGALLTELGLNER